MNESADCIPDLINPSRLGIPLDKQICHLTSAGACGGDLPSATARITIGGADLDAVIIKRS
jgi:hypothetical protein